MHIYACCYNDGGLATVMDPPGQRHTTSQPFVTSLAGVRPRIVSLSEGRPFAACDIFSREPLTHEAGTFHRYTASFRTMRTCTSLDEACNKRQGREGNKHGEPIYVDRGR